MDRVKKTLHVALSKDSSSEQLMAQIAPLNVYATICLPACIPHGDCSRPLRSANVQRSSDSGILGKSSAVFCSLLQSSAVFCGLPQSSAVFRSQ